MNVGFAYLQTEATKQLQEGTQHEINSTSHTQITQ